MSDHVRSIEKLLRACEMTLAGDTADHKSARAKDGEFHYIPFPPLEFCNDIDMVLSLTYHGGIDRPKFIDVGCGIGSKLVLAYSVGNYKGLHSEDLYGIEKDPRYLEVAKTLLDEAGIRGAHLIKGDFFHHTYKPYDIIYFYGPLMDHEKEVKLETLILDTAKPGAYVIAHYRRGSPQLYAERCTGISEHIWRVK